MFHVRPYSRLSALPQEAASISAPQKNADPFRTPAGSFMWNTSLHIPAFPFKGRG